MAFTWVIFTSHSKLTLRSQCMPMDAAFPAHRPEPGVPGAGGRLGLGVCSPWDWDSACPRAEGWSREHQTCPEEEKGEGTALPLRVHVCICTCVTTCVCVCMCLYACICVDTSVHVCKRICTCVNVCTCVPIHVCACKRMYICVYMCAICVCAYRCVYMYEYVCSCLCTPCTCLYMRVTRPSPPWWSRPSRMRSLRFLRAAACGARSRFLVPIPVPLPPP